MSFFMTCVHPVVPITVSICLYMACLHTFSGYFLFLPSAICTVIDYFFFPSIYFYMCQHVKNHVCFQSVEEELPCVFIMHHFFSDGLAWIFQFDKESFILN